MKDNIVKLGWRRRIAVGLPLGLMVMAVIIAFMVTRSGEQARLKLEFERQAITLASALEKSFDPYLEDVHAIERFYASSDDVDRQEFRVFISHALASHPGIQALEWIPRVPDAERAAYEEAARQEGFPDFQIAERAARGQMVRRAQSDAYFPVYFVEPLEGNEAAVGFDLASNPTRLEALIQARDTGAPVATARITLVQETGRQFGFLIFVPVYRTGPPHDTVEERRRNLEGYTLGVFRVGDMLTAGLEGLDTEEIVLQVFDASAPAGERLLASYGLPTDAGTDDEPEDEAWESPAGFDWTTTYDMAGRQWTLHVAPTLAYLSARRTLFAWAVLAGGLLFTGLLGAFLLLVTGQTARIERVVEERTAQLSQANTELEQEIADRKQAEEVLKKYAEELKHSNEELEQFATIASHDLQEPLRKIQAFGDRVQSKYKDVLDERGQDYLQRMQDAASRMQTLVIDLLTLSRVTIKGQPFVEVELDQVVHEVLSDLEVQIERVGGQVEVRDLPTLEVDPLQMRQLFQNLIGNALKFRREDRPPSVKVYGRALPGSAAPAVKPSTYEIHVEDNGIGFDEKYLDRIFKPFQRLHGRNTYEGTGIGLAICHKIAKRHGGALTATSTPGQGATFTITLHKTPEEGGAL